MKKGLLFSLFSLLSIASFAQHSGGCGSDPENATSNTYANYHSSKPVETVKVDFIVFPNPSTNYFVLDANSLDKGNAFRIQLYNLTGQAVRSFTISKENHYNIADLENGMYLLQFVDAKNKTIATRKLYKSNQVIRF